MASVYARDRGTHWYVNVLVSYTTRITDIEPVAQDMGMVTPTLRRIFPESHPRGISCSEGVVRVSVAVVKPVFDNLCTDAALGDLF